MSARRAAPGFSPATVKVASRGFGELVPAGFEVAEGVVWPQMEAMHLDLACLGGAQFRPSALAGGSGHCSELRAQGVFRQGAGGSGIGGKAPDPHHEAVGAAVAGGRWRAAHRP